MAIPKDPIMLLSYINTQLRDYYPSLEELCSTFDLNQEELKERLAQFDYYYNPKENQFK